MAAVLNPTAVDYLNFELEVGPGSGREYEISVRSPAGEAREIMRFPYDKLALENRLKDLQIALLRSGGKRRRVASPQEKAVQSFGLDLFNALISNEVRARYDVSRGLAEREDKGLRLILRIREPELAALPWEFLYDPRKGEYVCLSRSTPIIRYTESPQPVQPLWVRPPLHILGMAVSPLDLNPLDIDREKQRVEEAVKRLGGLVTLTWLEGQTWQDLQEAMQEGPWHIFHFIGHGGFNQRSDEGFVALAGESGRAFELTATNLARLLDHRQLKLVLLNACEGARGGNIDVFSSTASILVRSGIPAVLAMQYEITDVAAIELSRSFYRAVAQGMPLEAAVVEARKAISVAVTNTVEWGTPVLYLRSTNGRLFDVNLRRDQVNTLFSEARAAMAGENWSSAIEKLRTVLVHDPSHEEAQEALQLAERRRKLLQLYAEGREHYDAGRWYEARDSFQSAQAVEPNFRDVANLMGAVERRINEERVATICAQAEVTAEKEDWEEAIGLLNAALAINPGDEKIVSRLNLVRERKRLMKIYVKAKELYEAGRWADALIYFEEIKARVGDYKELSVLANDAAEKAAQELQEQNLQSDLATLRHKVERTISQEDWSGATLLLREILNLDQSDSEAKATLLYVKQQKQLHDCYVDAKEYVSSSRWEEALELLRKISSIDPGYKDVAEQISKAEQNIQIDVTYSGALEDIEMKRWEDADGKLQTLLRLDPSRHTEYTELLRTVGQNSKLKRLYAEGLEQYREKQWRAAYTSFQRVCEIDASYEDVNKIIEQVGQELNRAGRESKKVIPDGKYLWLALGVITLIISVWVVRTLVRTARPTVDSATAGGGVSPDEEKLLNTKKEDENATPHPVSTNSNIPLPASTPMPPSQNANNLLGVRQDIPKFSDYPVTNIFSGKNAPVILSSNEDRMYRTTLREAAKEKPDFAGHYKFAIAGCGTECAIAAVINLRTGKVYWFPETISCGFSPKVDDLVGESQIKYRLDSKLLMTCGLRADYRDFAYVDYYVFQDNRFRLVYSIQMPRAMDDEGAPQ